MYSFGICDDEKNACAEIKEMVSEYSRANNLSIEVTIWHTGEELQKYLLGGNKLDIIFLDIQLAGISGKEVGSFIRDKMRDYKTFIVYISSRTDYAMALFDTQPLGFLVKPISQSKVESILNKAIEIWTIEKKHFTYVVGRLVNRVPYGEIICFCSTDKKVMIQTAEKSYEFYGKLKAVPLGLPVNFVQIHQSYIINLENMHNYAYKQVEMVNGLVLPISRRYWTGVKDAMMNHYKECKHGR